MMKHIFALVTTTLVITSNNWSQEVLSQTKYQPLIISKDSVIGIYFTPGGNRMVAYSSRTRVLLGMYNAQNNLVNGLYTPAGFEAKKMIKDANGNCILFGNSKNNNLFHFFQIYKYDSMLNPLWNRRFEEFNTLPELGSEITTDISSNIIVCGSAIAPNMPGIFKGLIVKYTPSGGISWFVYHPGATQTYLNDVVTDVNNNIYVTGKRETTLGVFEMVVFKYDAAGNLVYDVSFTNGSYMEGQKILLDASGNVLIAGAALNNGYSDVVYYRLDQNTGNLLSNYVYSGTGAGNEYLKDLIAGSGDYYLSGNTWNGSDYDYFLLKFDISGSFQWVETYNSGPGINDFSNSAFFNSSINQICLTGFASVNSTNRDPLTISIDTNSNLQLIMTQVNPGDEKGQMGAIDQNGNIHILGSGRIARGYDCLHLIYSPGGNPLSSFFYFEPYSYSAGNMAVTDSVGNIYAAWEGEQVLGFTSDIHLVKYNSSGEPVCDYHFNGQAQQNDVLRDIIVKDNFVYMTGGSYNRMNIWNGFVIKLDTALNLIWSRTISDTTIKCILHKVAVDSFGNVYAAGGAQGAGAVVKFDSNGNEKWIRLHSVNNLGDWFTIKAIGSNEVVTAGLDGAGMIISRFDSSGTMSTVCSNLQLKSAADLIIYNNDFFVCGMNAAFRGMVARISSVTGSVIWQKTDTCNHNTYFLKLLVDNSGNLFAYGGAEYLKRKLTLWKLDSSGNAIWAKRYNSVIGDNSACPNPAKNSAVLNSNGDVLLISSSQDTLNNTTWRFIKFFSGGTLAFDRPFTVDSFSWGITGSIGLTSNPNEYFLSGQADSLQLSYGMFSLLLVKDTTFTIPNTIYYSDKSIGFHLHPNPTRQYVTLYFPGFIQPIPVRIYDSRGLLVMKEVINDERGRLDISRLSPGLYTITAHHSYERYFSRKLIIH